METDGRGLLGQSQLTEEWTSDSVMGSDEQEKRHQA